MEKYSIVAPVIHIARQGADGSSKSAGDLLLARHRQPACISFAETQSHIFFFHRYLRARL